MHPPPSNFEKILPVAISVIIAYRHSVIPSGFARILGEHTGINVVLVCSTGKVAAAAIRQFVPDVALLDVDIVDLNMIDLLSSIAADGLKTKVVCLTASLSGHDLTGAIAMGAKGILLKDAAPANLVGCVWDVFHGKTWFAAGVLDPVPERELRRRRQGERPISALTSRERQIALLVCEGLSNRQLGQQLNLTEGTVKVHLHKIYRKLGVRNRAALSAMAVTSRSSLKSRRGRRSEVVSQMP
jgi:DNA-binding NarL/FixJ family response regulator